MNTQNDFLDNAVDDELAIGMTEDLNAEMCSYMQSDTEIMCSSLRSDTCGNNLPSDARSLEFMGFVGVFGKMDLCFYAEIGCGLNRLLFMPKS